MTYTVSSGTLLKLYYTIPYRIRAYGGEMLQTELAMAAMGLSLLIWLRNRDGAARHDSRTTSRQLTSTTRAQSSVRVTDKFSLTDKEISK